MKNSYLGRLRGLLALTLMLVLFTSSALAQWSALPSLNSGRNWHQVALANNRLYTFGGIGIPPGGTADAYLTTAQYLDLASPTTWKTAASLLTQRFGGYAATVNGKIYIVGGLQQSGSQYVFELTTQEFDPAAGTYTQKTSQTTPQSDFAGVTIGDKIYLIGGIGVSGSSVVYTRATWMYDATNDNWTQLNDAPIGPRWSTASVVGNTIYLIGGTTGSGAASYSSKAYKGVVTGNTITWSAIADYPVAVTRAASGVLNGKLYVAAGAASTGELATMYSYDAAANKWNVDYPIPVGSYNMPVMVSDASSMYFVGGFNSPGVYKYTAGAVTPVANVAKKQFLITLKKGAQRTVTTSLRNDGIALLQGTLQIPPSATWLTTSTGNLNVSPGQSSNLSLTASSAALNEGEYEADVKLNSNDVNNPSITINVRLFVRDNLVVQPTMVVAEEGTGTWCGWCPYGKDSLVAVKKQFPNNVILLGYHGPASYNEPFNVPYADNVLDGLGLTGYPNASIHRWYWPADKAQMVSRNLWAPYTRTVLQQQPNAPVAIEMTNMSYDNNSKNVSASLKITTSEALLSSATTAYHVTAIITQDSMEYTQHLYVPNPDGSVGQTDLSPYYHTDVVRTIWPNDMGQKLNLPGTAVQNGVLLPGTEVLTDISFPVANVTDPQMAKLVIIVHAVNNGKLGDVLQGYETELMKPSAPSLAINANAISKDIKKMDTAVYETTVKNLTTAPITVDLARTQNDLPGTAWSAWFCIENDCKGVDEHTGSRSIQPGETVTVKLYVVGGVVVGEQGVVTLRYAGGTTTQSVKYTTNVVQGSNSVGTIATAGSGLDLAQNMPNPASGLTSFNYYLPRASAASIEVFSVTGVKVLSTAVGRQEAGSHTTSINVANLSNGIYTVVLNANGERVTRTMTVVR